MCHFLDDPRLFLYFVIAVHEFLAGPEQFNCLLFFRKKPSSCTFFGFPASSAYLNPFQKWLWFWDPYFHTEDNWGTHTQLLQKVKTFTDAYLHVFYAFYWLSQFFFKYTVKLAQITFLRTWRFFFLTIFPFYHLWYPYLSPTYLGLGLFPVKKIK